MAASYGYRYSHLKKLKKTYLLLPQFCKTTSPFSITLFSESKRVGHT